MKWFLDDVEPNQICYAHFVGNYKSCKMQYKVLKTKFTKFDEEYTEEFLREFPQWSYDGEWYVIAVEDIPSRLWFIFTSSILRLQEEYPDRVRAFNKIRKMVPYRIKLHMVSFGHDRQGHWMYDVYRLKFDPKILQREQVDTFLLSDSSYYCNEHFRGGKWNADYDEPFINYREYKKYVLSTDV